MSPLGGESRLQRVARIFKDLNHLMYSTFPVGVIIGGKLRTILENSVTYIHSNFAWFGEPLKMFGHVFETVDMANGLQHPGNSRFIVTMTYNGKLGVEFTADKAVFRGDRLKRLGDYVREEFELLEKIGNNVKLQVGHV